MNEIPLNDSDLLLRFEHDDERLWLRGIERDGQPILLPSEGAPGNPFAVVLRQNQIQSQHGPHDFRVTHLEHDERRLLAYLQHQTLPLLLALQVEVEGNVATWRAQAGWNGDEAIEADFYFPMLMRIVFDSPSTDRAIFPTVSGSEIGPTGRIEYGRNYLGGLSAPCFLIEGGGQGLAWLDDNRADFDAEPGNCTRRGYIVANQFPPPAERNSLQVLGDEVSAGPFVSVCHTRVLRAKGDIGLTDADMKAELRGHSTLPFKVRGDLVDLGPVKTYAYVGSWKVGALWLREKRQRVPMRTAPIKWFRDTTFLSEDMGDDMVRSGQSFHDFPQVMSDKERLGSDFFHIPGFHDAEVLGAPNNWLNRGDYRYAADNLGGLDALQRGIETVHRRGGRVLFYVEGLIVWKRSRIGKSRAREWALMKEDGSYDEHYKGFWHMCPACREWGDWLGETCAQIVRETSVDGFFIDSSAATSFHRCFNRGHNHPHPDVWNWGMRQMLRRVREAVDKADPNTILLVEGAADLARQWCDASLAHSHDWTKGTFSVPLARFLYADSRVFESWGAEGNSFGRPHASPEAQHVFNVVHGHRIYAHNPHRDRMAALGLATRRLYDAFPEVCERAISPLEIAASGGIAQGFEGLPFVFTVGNPTGAAAHVRVRLPVTGGALFDRVSGQRLALREASADVALEAWQVRAFEVRA